MTEEQDSDKSNKGQKTLKISIKEKKPVITSQGTFYVRYLAVSDLEKFNSYLSTAKDSSPTNLKSLGELALKTFVCIDNSSDNKPALTGEIYEQLTTEDIETLAIVVARECNASLLPGGDVLEALGTAIYDVLAKYAKNTAEINQRLAKNFQSLSETVRANLGDNLKGMFSITESLKMSSAVESARKVFENQESLFKSKNSISQLDWDSLESKTKLIEPFHHRPIFPKVEDTPAGRAAIASEDSARQLREVAGLVGQMAEQLGKLHTVFLTEVIPQWVNDLEASSQATNTTLNQAERSLFWAKWAIIASVVVTVLMTGWQVNIAREYKLENDEQQKTSELLMRKQLEAIQEQNKLLAADSNRLQEELIKLNQAIANQSPLKKFGSSRKRKKLGLRLGRATRNPSDTLK